MKLSYRFVCRFPSCLKRFFEGLQQFLQYGQATFVLQDQEESRQCLHEPDGETGDVQECDCIDDDNLDDDPDNHARSKCSCDCAITPKFRE